MSPAEEMRRLRDDPGTPMILLGDCEQLLDDDRIRRVRGETLYEKLCNHDWPQRQIKPRYP